MMKRIAIHGVPRSGTSWLASIFDSSPTVSYRHQPLFSYAFKGFLNEDSSNSDIVSFFNYIAGTKDSFVTQKEQKEKETLPTFNKGEIQHVAYKEARYHHIVRNLLEKDSQINVVGIVRNPKAVLASWFNAPKEFDKQNWSFEKEWELAESKNQNKREEFYGYQKWKEVATLFLQLSQDYPDRFYLIEYKDMLNDSRNEIEQLFEFCGINFTEQTIDYLKESSSLDNSHDAYSVYRKKKDDNSWVNILPNEVSEAIDSDLSNTPLERFIS